MIGMSGGVDSSVATALLIEQGFDVTGVTLKLWDGDDFDESNNFKDSTCCSLDDINDARMVAYKLGIPHYVLNFKDVFNISVVKYFADEYNAGRTPNPCIACNKFIKMGGMLEKALSMGFDYIATGHYARIIENGITERFELYKGLSAKKDQSYVLYNFTQRQLKHTLMPLGEYTKDQTRELAEKYNLLVAKKPDSQEICFVSDNDYGTFLEKYTGQKSIPGNFVDSKGNMLGMHKGIIHYTIGQRKGLGIAFGKRMFVTGIDADSNTVFIGEENELYRESLVAKEINFIEIEKLESSLDVQVKIRYNFKPAKAVISPLDNGQVLVNFEEGVRAVTPGQSVVFYNGDSVIGGGTIV